ncbi:M20 family metallopeptidase [Iamia sp. SCSIO 61187]|uniref:M20 family metallopeptidase n=1 Tax=Iamia sp. SCSIO 61187 TaxID=2722752 RepID=UPI001C639095|nr:M20 family metallopeptidase [Iamia sp. SCSIO 61187]QYG92921.1 M20 family metallopeptidase [Iamia sp. SCSIO 61187]
MTDPHDVKARIEAEVDRLADTLLEVSHSIHAHPEVLFEERHAHDVLTRVLEDEGLAVERSAYGLETGFAARAGTEGPLVAVCCEYDALPGIGHACGHNVIAAAGLGAGLAAATVAADLGGRVLILGTPGEEGGGGKQLMMDAGALEGVEAAVMVHPAGVDLRSMDTLAIQRATVTYTGHAAHASAAPEKGRNALDAMVLGYVNVAALRQHISPSERVHGIFLEAGQAANIVPARTVAQWYVRSPGRDGLAVLRERVEACLQAGATAAGCEMDVDWYEPAYDELVGLDTFDELYAANAARVGRTPGRAGDEGVPTVLGSTDMGNISQVVPSIHPMIAVSPPDVAIHTEAFVGFAGGPEGDAAVLDGAKALACTMADLWLDPDALPRIREEFARRTG